EPPPTPRAFIPPAPERTVNRPRRMPGIDELPRPAQAELRAKRGEADVDHPEKRKVSLLRRLAAPDLPPPAAHHDPASIATTTRPTSVATRPPPLPSSTPPAPTHGPPPAHPPALPPPPARPRRRLRSPAALSR